MQDIIIEIQNSNLSEATKQRLIFLIESVHEYMNDDEEA